MREKEADTCKTIDTAAKRVSLTTTVGSCCIDWKDIQRDTQQENYEQARVLYLYCMNVLKFQMKISRCFIRTVGSKLIMFSILRPKGNQAVSHLYTSFAILWSVIYRDIFNLRKQWKSLLKLFRLSIILTRVIQT